MIVAILLILDGADVRSARLEAYSACVSRQAVRLAHGPDPANIVADAADFRCAAARSAALDAVMALDDTDAMRAVDERLFNSFVAGTRAKAAAAVVELRARRR